jgi:hypothetical protein
MKETENPVSAPSAIPMAAQTARDKTTTVQETGNTLVFYHPPESKSRVRIGVVKSAYHHLSQDET